MVKNGVKKSSKASSNKLQQISESPSQSESNCFSFGIKSYLKDFYQKEDSDQESVLDSKKRKNKKPNRYSSSESEETESEDGELRHYKDIIKNCDKFKNKLKNKSRRKLHKFINYSRDQWNLFGTNESDDENMTRKKNKKLVDEERQQYKSSKRWSVYVWRSIFIIGCTLLIGGLLMATSFLFSERQVEIGKQEEMEIIDRDAMRFNQILNQTRAFSLALIAVGLLLFLSTLLLPPLIGVSLNCFHFGRKRKDQTFESFFNNHDKSDSDSETCSKVYVNKCDKGARKQKLKDIDEPIEDNISKIPTLEQIQTVQPEREKDETFLRKN